MTIESTFLTKMLSATIGSALLWLPFATSVAARPLTARDSIAKPVEQAERLLRQGKFKDAFSALQEADRIPDKSPYETFIIAETRAEACLESGNDRDAVRPIESVLSTGLLGKAATLRHLEDLIDIDARIDDDAGVIKYTERYYSDGGADETPNRLMAEAYYHRKDFATAARTIRKVVDAGTASGKHSDDGMLLLLANSEYRRHNNTGYEDVLERLLAENPKITYWKAVFAVLPQTHTFNDRTTLELDRLKRATGVLDSPRDYMVMAELALEAKLPAEARAILTAGAETNILGKSGDIERQDRLAAMAEREAMVAESGLVQKAEAAAASPSGDLSVALGATYASFGRYVEALDAFEQGEAKGHITAPELATLDVGIAAVHAGQYDKAKLAFKSLSGSDVPAVLSKLWLVRVDTLSKHAQTAEQLAP